MITTKRAVLYARVSSDDRSKDGRNLAGQIEMCREFALDNGWQVVAELSEDDRGASGASFELPELNHAREMAQSGEFEVLVVREIDRLSRKLAKQLIVEEQLNRAGVEVVYVLASYENSPEGRLNKHIRATIAEYEREKIAERMVRGRRQVVKNGKIMLHGDKPPYGYRLEKDGRNLEIHEEEAAVVRLIYTWYVEGDEKGRRLSSREIAKRLTQMRVPTWADLRGMFKKRGKGEWSWRLVIRVLESETYAGHWHYGKRNTFNGNKINAREWWLTFNVPPIVSEEMWGKAQLQRKMNTSESKRNIKRDYLLRGRVRCGLCHSSVNCYATVPQERKLYLYYKCNALMGNIANVKCHLPSFRVEVVDKLVWDWVKALLTQPRTLETGLAEYQESREQFIAPIRDRLIVLNDLWQDSNSQLNRLLDLYISGDVPRELLVDKKQRLEATLASLDKERDDLNLSLETDAITEKDILQIREFAAQIAEGLEPGNETFDDRRRVIELLDVGASLTVEDGQKFIDIWCFLGRNKLSVGSSTSRSAAHAKSCRWNNGQSLRRLHRTCRRAPWLGARESQSSGFFPCGLDLIWNGEINIQSSSAEEILVPRPSHRIPNHSYLASQL
jgi:site-specific DNA recombinase